MCLRHCRILAAACKLQTKMSEMTSPSPSQPSGADGVRVKRLERELAELKSSQSIQSQNHNKALDDNDKLEADAGLSVQHILQELERRSSLPVQFPSRSHSM